MRVAVYGGSFNPPHVGHAMVAAWLLWTEQADAVWLVPTYDHAFGKALAPFARRRAWCAAMAEAIDPRVQVSELEAELGGTSYTVRTLDTLSARHPEHRFVLVVGTDQEATLPRWREAERLMQTYPRIVVGRQGAEGATGAVQFPSVSSTEVRRRLGRGEAVDTLVPAAVRRQWTAEDRALLAETVVGPKGSTP